MIVLNLKRLSIDELNTLAGKIIDEISIRDVGESSNDFFEEIDKLYFEEFELQARLSSLKLKKEYIDDEINRIEEFLDAVDDKEGDLLYKLNIGELHIL